LVRALPEPFRADAEAAASAVVIDPARWGEHDKKRSDLVAALQAAVVGRRRVRMQYTKRRGQQSERWISPLGLVDKDDIWYLIAWTPKGQRTFRVERVVSAELTDEPFERPADFDLSAAWNEIVEQMEVRRSGLTATVLMDERQLWVMQDRLGRHCEVDGMEGDRVRIKVTAPTPLMIAQHLAGWGGSIEVIDPPSVQAELARLGSELAARYSGTE
jgi:predicted DNA-binding transcriptional regulator YafY